MRLARLKAETVLAPELAMKSVLRRVLMAASMAPAPAASGAVPAKTSLGVFVALGEAPSGSTNCVPVGARTIT